METKQITPWKSTVAGIVNIVAAIFNVFGILGMGFVIFVFQNPELFHAEIRDAASFVDIFVAILPVTIIYLVAGTLTLLGGIFALKRKTWWLALLGSITALFPTVILGIVSMAFLQKGRGPSY